MKLDRIISIATLLAAMAAIFLVLRKPAPVAPASGAVAAPTASSVQSPVAAQGAGSNEGYKPAAGMSTAPSQSQSAAQAPAQASANTAAAAKTETQVNSDAITTMLAKTLAGQGSGPLTPDSNVGNGEPNIKDQQVTMDGDIVHGRFLTEIGGKDVWVTVSGHMGEKDGYATFDPTEFKVGDTEVPVSLVNPLLQQKLAEQRDKLKIPNGPQ